MKKSYLIIICIILVIASIAAICVGKGLRKKNADSEYDDGIELTNPNSIYLEDSKVTVDFSDVLLTDQKEERKLIVSSQRALIDFKIENRLITILDADFLKKVQNIKYTGDANFIVDLSKLQKSDIKDNKDEKRLTIMIEHPCLEVVKIDPDKVQIGSTQNGWFNPGKIKLTVEDYNNIEKEITKRLTEKFNTSENGQTADDNALTAVKNIYEPIVKAIDSDYSVEVMFK